MSNDAVDVEGEVTEALPGTTFKVRLVNGMDVMATLSGKMRKNYIKVNPGDFVKVELSPYDLTQGRIVYRR